MAKKEEYEVTILSREEIVTYPRIGEPAHTIVVTYTAAGLPPSVLFIPKVEYTLEREKKLIREDIERRLRVRPETYKV